MPLASFSLLFFSSPPHLLYIYGQSKGVRTFASTISNLEGLDISLEEGWAWGRLWFTTIESGGWSIVNTMEANLVASFNIQCFLSSKFGFQLFQATHVHGLSNNQVIKWYLRLELRGRCPLLRFLSSSSHLHYVYPISVANQREFELLQGQSQTLRD